MRSRRRRNFGAEPDATTPGHILNPTYRKYVESVRMWKDRGADPMLKPQPFKEPRYIPDPALVGHAKYDPATMAATAAARPSAPGGDLVVPLSTVMDAETRDVPTERPPQITVLPPAGEHAYTPMPEAVPTNEDVDALEAEAEKLKEEAKTPAQRKAAKQAERVAADAEKIRARNHEATEKAERAARQAAITMSARKGRAGAFGPATATPMPKLAPRQPGETEATWSARHDAYTYDLERWQNLTAAQAGVALPEWQAAAARAKARLALPMPVPDDPAELERLAAERAVEEVRTIATPILTGELARRGAPCPAPGAAPVYTAPSGASMAQEIRAAVAEAMAPYQHAAPAQPFYAPQAAPPAYRPPPAPAPAPPSACVTPRARLRAEAERLMAEVQYMPLGQARNRATDRVAAIAQLITDTTLNLDGVPAGCARPGFGAPRKSGTAHTFARDAAMYMRQGDCKLALHHYEDALEAAGPRPKRTLRAKLAKLGKKLHMKCRIRRG